MGHRGSPSTTANDYAKSAYEYTRAAGVGYDYNYDPAMQAQDEPAFDPYADLDPGEQQQQQAGDRQSYFHQHAPGEDQRPVVAGGEASRDYESRNQESRAYKGGDRRVGRKRRARRASPDYSAYDDGAGANNVQVREFHASSVSYREREGWNPHFDRGWDAPAPDPVDHISQTRGYATNAPSSSYTPPTLFRAAPIQRSPTPPGQRRSPTPPPLPAEPSAAYLRTAAQPSKPLADPSEKRKLLILDLNGTLVFRGPHKRRERPRRWGKPDSTLEDAPNPEALSHDAPFDPDPYSEHGPRPLRPVHPRPFLLPFRTYLFHPATRAWLDTMVWSSAQPHSVGDMVEKAFGEEKARLVGVWARDTLGLSEGDYHKKTQTTKDLAKPWAALPLLKPGEEHSVQNASKHSASTTLLLDDSPRKAHLQPWNHLCIREYIAEMRAADVKVRDAVLKEAQKAASEKMAVEGIETEASGVEVETETSGAEGMDTETSGAESGLETPLSPSLVPASPSALPETLNKKKRKREKKPRPPPPSPTHDAHAGYDPTLLAVVGILDAVKGESNVAGWVRSGGLRGVVRRREKAEGKLAGEKLAVEEGAGVGEEVTEGVKGELEVGVEGADVAEGILGEAVASPKKKRRLSDSPTPRSSPIHPSSSPVRSIDEDAEDEPRVPLASLDDPAAGAPLSSGEPCSSTPAQTSTPSSTPNAGEQNPSLWFEDEATFAYWAQRGVKALEELGIEVVPGVVGSNGV